jgi:gluconokinase
MASYAISPVVIMGVQGSGKSTIGNLLGRRLGVPFLDGDSLHPEGNKRCMAAGHALSDAQRQPWLHAVGERLAGGSGIVVACSALKRSYRDLLREHAPTMLTVFASGDIELIHNRISARQHEYMPPSLLQTQFDDLEPLQADETGLTIDIARTPEQIVDQILYVVVEGSTQR